MSTLKLTHYRRIPSMRGASHRAESMGPKWGQACGPGIPARPAGRH